MKFAIITYILHKEHKKAYYSYEPYIREMNIWLNSPKEIIVVAPKIFDFPNAIESAYLHKSISFRKIPVISFVNFPQVLRSTIMLPKICFKILRAMKAADHIHLRCPGNIGLISCLIQILFPKKPKTVKYAGNWDPNAKQPLSYRLQKYIFSCTFLTRNIKVLVYGEWPNQSRNIIPFFTASFSETENALYNKNFTSPFKFIFVGSLSIGKRPLYAIHLIESLVKNGIPAKLEIYGSGELKNELQEYISTKNLEPFVSLMGNCKLEELKHVYKASHFLILASQSEGWPKAVAEAMWFGCIPIATAVSCVPWMLNNGRRGILIPEVRVDRGQRSVERVEVKSGLPYTFPENRQFECLPDSPEGERGNVSRTGFSETPAYRQGRHEFTSGTRNGGFNVLEDTVNKIIKLIKDPEKIKRMSLEAQEWSQQYTLEKFEEAIKELLAPQPPKGEQKS